MQVICWVRLYWLGPAVRLIWDFDCAPIECLTGCRNLTCMSGCSDGMSTQGVQCGSHPIITPVNLCDWKYSRCTSSTLYGVTVTLLMSSGDLSRHNHSVILFAQLQSVLLCFFPYSLIDSCKSFHDTLSNMKGEVQTSASLETLQTGCVASEPHACLLLQITKNKDTYTLAMYGAYVLWSWGTHPLDAWFKS